MSRNVGPKRIAAACLLAVIAACGRVVPVDEPATEPQTGAWQAIITVPGGEIETSFELEQDDTGYHASLVNGQERIRIDEVTFADGELVLRFPVFNNEIRAQFDGESLQGSLTLIKRFGTTQTLPFRAMRGTEHPHAAAEEPAREDLSGRWAVHFVSEDGSVSPSIGEFAQRGSRLFGTFVNPDGDHRYLAGHVDGSDFELSTFDGAHAFLFTGSIENGAIVDADFWSGDTWHQTWSAHRDDDVTLPDAFDRNHLRDGFDSLEFEFPNQDGEPISMADSDFAGKVCIVMLGGTWCPNCNDEARFMSALHAQYRTKGLEVIALMFEHFEEHAVAAEQVRRFRDKHGIEFHTLIAGISDKADAADKLPALESVFAFPTTIFIDRQGKVRTIHSGFSGPGTGKYHEQLKARFEDIVADLLAEQLTEDPEETAETDAAEDEQQL